MLKKLAPAPLSLNVLVVDDERELRESLSQILQRMNHKVFQAATGEEALEILRDRGVDLPTSIHMVLLDVNMPGINGEELCRFIKGNTLFAGIQVVFCSAADEAELQRLVKTCGADGYVRKDQLIAKEILDLLT